MLSRIIVVAVCLAIAGPHAAAQSGIQSPVVPANLTVPSGYAPFMIGHADGTQNYSCLPSGNGFAWTLYGPQATLFDDDGKQLTTHFLSPNPDESGALRPTWQDSRDTSRVWGVVVDSSTDPAFVAPGSIAWLLLRVVGSEYGSGPDKLASTVYIQRINTAGGVAPAAGCSRKADIGKKALVPYTTDYVFYQ